MAGVSWHLDISRIHSLASAINEVASIVLVVKSNKPQWDSLNYRVDLPGNLDIASLNVHQLAELYLLRSFHKVWLRNQFRSDGSKDGSYSTQKHLKP